MGGIWSRKRGRALAGALAGIVLAALTAACTASAPPAGPPLSAPPTHNPPGRAGTPGPDHVVLVVMENHGLDQVLGNDKAPFLNALAADGALFTGASAIAHPSQPNYVALFSGDTQGLTDDSCPNDFTGPNLAQALLDAHLTFSAYAEDLPSAGYTGCSSDDYARKHNPVADFTDLPSRLNQPFSAFSSDFASLPTVSLVVPNLCHDMHDCDVATGDGWLSDHLGGYLDWARTHDSLLIVTWDEDEHDNSTAENHIPLLIAGQSVRPGRYAEPVDHYRLLRTLEDMYRLRYTGHAADSTPITDIWTPGS